jgi:hypothetical protein
LKWETLTTVTAPSSDVSGNGDAVADVMRCGMVACCVVDDASVVADAAAVVVVVVVEWVSGGGSGPLRRRAKSFCRSLSPVWVWMGCV